MNLDDIAEHISRIDIRPESRRLPPGIETWWWDVTINLRFDPPFHFAGATAPTIEDAMQLATMRAKVHIAMVKAGS